MKDELNENLEQARDLIQRLPSLLNEKILQEQDKQNQLQEYQDAFTQFFDMAISLNQQVVQDQKLSSAEASDVGHYGLQLVEQLAHWLQQTGSEQSRLEVDQIALLVARWLIRHKGQIKALESIVNAFAHLANSVKKKKDISSLLELMNAVVQAAGPELRHDIESVSLFRPWRLLNINRCILAARTHDVSLMRQVFDDLVRFLPQDAPGFFDEAMAEMENADYPVHVREVFLEYHQANPKQRLH